MRIPRYFKVHKSKDNFIFTSRFINSIKQSDSDFLKVCLQKCHVIVDATNRKRCIDLCLKSE